MIPLCVPHLGGNEKAYLAECVDTTFVSSVGAFVERFEAEFAEYVGARYAVACSSGTAALHVALRVMGAGADTSVAVSTMTFIASANAVAYTGARPWLIDSELGTWNLDTHQLHAEVVRRAQVGETIPDVIEVVHVLGHPADIEPVLDLRDRFGIAVVEDAAEALGATYRGGRLDGRHVGTLGDVGCYSFNGNKIITTGGGGMIVTDDEQLARRARHLTTQAKLPGRGYLHDEVGYNYRLTNVAAALGTAQLEQLKDFLEIKRQVAHRYRDGLGDLGVTGPVSAPWARPSFWLSSVLLDRDGPSRDVVLDELEQAGIGARPLWAPLHRQKPYAVADRLGGEVADDLYARGISLPSSVGLSEGDQDHVIRTLRAAVKP